MTTGFDFDFPLEEPDRPQADAIDLDEFKRAVGSFATGVTVVTARNGDRMVGFTANSFTSVSLDPPLVLLCLDRRAPSLLGFDPGGAFAVNLLGADQEHLSRHFARHAEDKFAGIAVRTSAGGLPLLDGCLAAVECTLEHRFYGGDHVILVGRVVALSVAEEGEPLVFFRSRYRALAP